MKGMGVQSFVRRTWHVVVITLFVLVLAIVNYKKGSYLTGWDNLQTELAPLVAIKRAFFSVWQEYQSFGLIAGMAHAADLPRAMVGLFLGSLFPASMVRYVEQMIMIWIGALGTFYLIFHSLEKVHFRKLYSLLSSIIYVVNIGSIQILSLPFETFSLFFAALPWFMLSLFKHLDSRKPLTHVNLLSFIFIQVVGSGFAVSQQLFVVYGLIVSILFICHIAKNPTLHSLKRIFILGLLIIVANLYWILPQIEFLRTNGAVVQSSKINQISTEDIYYRNLEKGVPEQFFFLKNFFLDTVDMKNAPMLLPWLQWYEFAWTKTALLILTFISLTGILSHKRHTLELKLLYGLFAVALLSNTPYFSTLNSWIRDNPFINQIFRSPFTKFVVPYSLVFSFLFAEGMVVLHNVLQRIFRKYTHILLAITVTISVGVISYPAFDGYFYPKQLQTSLPNSYIHALEFFKNAEKNKRIALLPDYTYWGWYFNDWGYNGSGFLWYGIEQPIISRTFDVWSRESENYYWEIKQAIESEDATLFQNVANKYNVSYFLLDTSLVPVTSSAKGMQYERLEHILPQIPSIKRIKQWDNLVLYENIEQARVAHFMEVVSDMPVMGPHIEQTNRDTAYSDSFGYVTEQDLNENVAIYPFANLTTQTRLSDPDWKLTENSTEFILEYTNTVNPDTHDLIMPFERFQQVLYTDIGVATKSGYMYTLRNKKGNLTVHFPKILLKSFDVTETEVENCGNVSGNLNINKDIDGLFIETNNQANACFGYSDATLDQKYSYLAQLEFEPIQGRSLLFYTLDLTKKESVIEDRLRENQAYFIIPPRYPYGLGYNFSFQQNSYTNIPSTNKLKQLAIYAFPFDELKQIKFVQKNAPEYVYKELVDHTSQKYAYYLYSLQINSSSYPSPYITLYQAYHPGWKAYRVTDIKPLNLHFPFFTGTEIVAHLRVNNWANGWKLPDDFNFEREKIVIVFWPQYLQYVGFILLWITVCILVFPWKHKKHSSH